VLSEALWAHRTSKHGATKVTLFELVHGQEVVLLVEVNLQTHRVTEQDTVSAEDYAATMMEQIDEVQESQFRALKEIKKEKRKVINAYNKKVKRNLFQVGECRRLVIRYLD
jgi:hypothetical protein